MVKALHTLGILALISTGVVCVLCAAQSLQGAPEIEGNTGLPIVEKIKRSGALNKKDSQKMISPLVMQAEAFALYLNPPKPPKPRKTLAPEPSRKQSILVAKTVEIKQKFDLIATCYYRSRPEESMALVSEPGSGTRWVKQGASLGHFVLEKVERGMIAYRDGDRLVEVAVDTKAPVRTKKTKQTMLASSQTGTSPPKPSKARVPPAPAMKRSKPLHRLGLGRPEVRPAAYDGESKGSG